MKKSIGIKLFLGITCFALMIVSLSWILNTRYLETYYLEKKKDGLIQYGKEIQSLYENDIENVNEQIMKIENKIDTYVTVVSKNGDVQYSSTVNHGRMGNGNGKMGRSIHMSSADVEIVLGGEIILRSYRHPRLDAQFLVCALPWTGGIIMLETSVATISESVEIAKEFHIYIGIISFIIGTGIAFLYSKMFTKPIIELNNVARSMSRLDFKQKYEAESNDEIGELGKTMNLLSDQLDSTIKELNGANKKLKEDIEKEKQIDHMRKEFISSVSHELKTPISLIQGYAEGLKDNIATDEENKNFYCEVIMDESNKMEKLVKDLLELSQIESGYLEIKMETFNIVHILEKLVNRYKPILNKRKICAKVDTYDKYVNVVGDRLKIEQVLVNFMSNAVNHIDENGRLKITVKDHDSKIRIGIYNTGSSIPTKEIDKIWDSFYKVDKSRERKYGGTGLGLSIVKGILEIHDSSFGVFNKNEGVEFWFTLKK